MKHHIELTFSDLNKIAQFTVSKKFLVLNGTLFLGSLFLGIDYLWLSALIFFLTVATYELKLKSEREKISTDNSYPIHLDYSFEDEDIIINKQEHIPYRSIKKITYTNEYIILITDTTYIVIQKNYKQSIVEFLHKKEASISA